MPDKSSPEQFLRELDIKYMDRLMDDLKEAERALRYEVAYAGKLNHGVTKETFGAAQANVDRLHKLIQAQLTTPNNTSNTLEDEEK